MKYRVQLIDEATGFNKTIRINSDEYILEAAEAQGIELPVSCRAGVCITCTGKIVKGKVDQDHTFLKQRELEAGFVLTCRAYACSDCVILINQEEALLDL